MISDNRRDVASEGNEFSIMDDSRLRIALFIPDLSGGGTARVMVTLANNLALRHYKVDMVLINARGPNLDQLSPNIRVIDLNARRIISSIPRLANYLRKQRPSVLLSARDPANIAALLAVRWANVNTRIVVASHQTVSEANRHANGWRKYMLPIALRQLYPSANKVVAVSEGAATDLSKIARLPLEQIKVIYNPVVSRELLLSAEMPVEHPWFRAGQLPVILSVGRLVPAKDHDTLLRAFSLLVKRFESRLMILGEGPGRTRLQSLASELGVENSFSLPGYVTNPYAYMNKTAVFVLSSAWEALPTALIEAMACGIPVVSTNCPSGPFEILEGGKHGRLVPVGDVAALADALADALAGNVAPPAASSVSRFQVDTAVDAYESVLLGN